MKTVLFAGLAMTVGLGMTTAAAAQDDDWEFQQDPAHNIAIAVARYDAGQMIVVQCRDNKLTAVLAGLPAATAPLELSANRADGRSDQQIWAPAGAPGAYRSGVSARDIRFMKGGGLYSVRTGEGAETAFRGAFDLPTQSANLDRVLTACGWATTDERDRLAMATGISLVNPEGGDRRRTRTQRGATSRSPRREIAPPPAPSAPPPAEQLVSCVVRDLHLRECRVEHPGSAAALQPALRAYEGREVFLQDGADAAANEGGVVFLSGPLIVVTADYITR